MSMAVSCAQCGTKKTPCWRKGPEGNRTLCNACGIRWKRMMRKGKSFAKEKKAPKPKVLVTDSDDEVDFIPKQNLGKRSHVAKDTPVKRKRVTEMSQNKHTFLQATVETSRSTIDDEDEDVEVEVEDDSPQFPLHTTVIEASDSDSNDFIDATQVHIVHNSDPSSIFNSTCVCPQLLHLDDDLLMLGRGTAATITCASDERNVHGISRVHAQIRKSPSGLLLMDTSKLGVVLNGAKVERYAWCKLHVGDTFVLGKVHHGNHSNCFQFRVEECKCERIQQQMWAESLNVIDSPTSGEFSPLSISVPTVNQRTSSYKTTEDEVIERKNEDEFTDVESDIDDEYDSSSLMISTDDYNPLTEAISIHNITSFGSKWSPKKIENREEIPILFNKPIPLPNVTSEAMTPQNPSDFVVSLFPQSARSDLVQKKKKAQFLAHQLMHDIGTWDFVLQRSSSIELDTDNDDNLMITAPALSVYSDLLTH